MSQVYEVYGVLHTERSAAQVASDLGHLGWQVSAYEQGWFVHKDDIQWLITGRANPLLEGEVGAYAQLIPPFLAELTQCEVGYSLEVFEENGRPVARYEG